MKSYLKACGLLAIILLPFTAARGQVLEWARNLGGPAKDHGHAIAVDDSGFVYTTGYFEDTADFDPGAGNFLLNSNGLSDIFVSRLDVNGNFIWALHIGGTGDDQANSVAVDHVGNIVITGYFTGTVDFDPGAGVFTLTSNASYDLFIAKYGPTGNFIWAKGWGGNSGEVSYSLVLDSSGNIYSTGYYRNTVDFDPGSGTHYLTSAGDKDIFVLKLDENGNFVWAVSIGGIGDDRGYSIIAADYGNIYIIGNFGDTVDFDPSTGTYFLTAPGQDIFVMKLNNDGNLFWARQFTGGSNDIGRSIALDDDENVYTTGSFGGVCDFDPGPGTYFLTSGSENMFISKLDSAGNFVWAKQVGNTYGAVGLSIALGDSANVYITGIFEDTIDFDPGPGVYNLTDSSWQIQDIFILKLDAAGNFVWAKAIGSINDDYCSSLAVDALNNVYITGRFWGYADFDPPFGANLFSNGHRDIFVAKYSQGPVGIVEHNDNTGTNVFPTITNGNITINTGSMNAETRVEVFDITGKAICRKIYYNSSSVNMNIEVANGLYFVKVYTGNKINITKIVKQ